MFAQGQGDGTFANTKLLAVPPQANGLAIGDWNGDKFQDLVVANYGESSLSILRGKGDGTFQQSTVMSNHASSHVVLAGAVMHLNLSPP